ncbi:MAG TPA: F0F1 ATP synthase subunit B, partial [Candidatus Limnocylindria bacterium]
SEAEKVSARARDEIVAEKDRAMAEIRSQVADLALLAAGKLVGREMDAPTQRRLVNEFLADARPARRGRN